MNMERQDVQDKKPILPILLMDVAKGIFVGTVPATLSC
jgi:hypothetical protein